MAAVVGETWPDGHETGVRNMNTHTTGDIPLGGVVKKRLPRIADQRYGDCLSTEPKHPDSTRVQLEDDDYGRWWDTRGCCSTQPLGGD